jgi:hypothetical protein
MITDSYTDATIDLAHRQQPKISENAFIPCEADLTPESIVIVIRPDWIPVNIKEGESVILGRAHPSNADRPLVDLARYGGTAYGLSRNHAALHRINGLWWIEDLGSSNGTWVNGERLAPFSRRLLKGNVVRLSLANMDISLMLPNRIGTAPLATPELAPVAAGKPVALLSAVVASHNVNGFAA